MFKQISRIFDIPELKQKILFTLGLLFVSRIGVFVPVPGIDGEAAEAFFRQASGGGQSLFNLVNMFSGGAFSQMTVSALGVMPYISASIIMQILLFLIPSLQREMRESPQTGRRKMIRWTRVATLCLASIQAIFLARYAVASSISHPGIVLEEILKVKAFGTPWLFYLVVLMTMTTGTLFLMWIGEQITEKGIGNGISLIITVNILSSLPGTLTAIFNKLNLDSQEPGEMNFSTLVVLAIVFSLVILATILVIQGQRRIPVQYARRVVGRKESQGGKTYIPLKVNYAGVIPVIFASALLMFPATLAEFAGTNTGIAEFARKWFAPGTTFYLFTYAMLIIFFTYFWTATQFNPVQIASDMKRNGAFIPGVRQGKPTQEFLEMTMGRITFIGAMFLALIALLPTIFGRLMNIDPSISYFFGGTPILILVGVVLDTLRQIESHLLMKNYEGFIRKGRVRGR
jgi:preprotein translocase subunit SecY